MSRRWEFGPERGDDGVVFRLWAPAAERVELLLDESEPTAMNRHTDGWWKSPRHPTPDGTVYRFRINGEVLVPDPASRAQADDVHGPSVLVAPNPESGSAWKGRPWEETVLYELHVGTATPEGTFRALIPEISRLAEIGITAIELMPIADFPGRWNWGYDGVLPFAPDRTYGSPDDLRALIDAAHRQNVSIWLDVVYNHFGPDGNYLHLYAPNFFNPEIDTPWGAGIEFTEAFVRRFFIENALYWLDEFGFDGLRLDAVHAIKDPSPTHILTELAQTVRAEIDPRRQVHLVLENDDNAARFLGPDTRKYTAQWNDDIHHTFHVLLTGERHGYYRNYAEHPEADLITALSTGYVYQGQTTADGTRRGEPSGHLSPTRFVAFLQNHDQIGNRAFGERLTSLASDGALRAAVAVQLLIPQIPLIFMGEPWGCTDPFQFFCDFGDELANAVKEGRRKEFGLDDLPDPTARETVERSSPRVSGATPDAAPGSWCRFYAELLATRSRHLVPMLASIESGTAHGGKSEAIVARWAPGWVVVLNLADRPRTLPDETRLAENARIVYSTVPATFASGTVLCEAPTTVPAWTVIAAKEDA